MYSVCDHINSGVKHKAHGLCTSCYNKSRYLANKPNRIIRENPVILESRSVEDQVCFADFLTFRIKMFDQFFQEIFTTEYVLWGKVLKML